MDGRIFICFKFYQYIHKREIKYTYIQILCIYTDSRKFWQNFANKLFLHISCEWFEHINLTYFTIQSILFMTIAQVGLKCRSRSSKLQWQKLLRLSYPFFQIWLTFLGFYFSVIINLTNNNHTFCLIYHSWKIITIKKLKPS